MGFIYGLLKGTATSVSPDSVVDQYQEHMLILLASSGATKSTEMNQFYVNIWVVMLRVCC